MRLPENRVHLYFQPVSWRGWWPTRDVTRKWLRVSWLWWLIDVLPPGIGRETAGVLDELGSREA